MSKIWLEELETRLLLTGAALSPGDLLSPSLVAETAHSPAAGAEGGPAILARPGQGGGESSSAQFPIPNPAFAGNRDNGSPGMENMGGFQRVVILIPDPAPLLVTTNLGADQLAFPVVEKGVPVTVAAPTQGASFSVSSAAPLESAGDLWAEPDEIAAQVSAHPAPSSVMGIDLSAAIVSVTSGLPLSPLPSLLVVSTSPEPAGQIGGPLRNGLSLSLSPLSGTATVPLSELRSLAQQAPPVAPSPFAPPEQHSIPLVPSPADSPDQPTLPRLPTDLSALQSGLFQFLEGLAPRTQQALSLPPVNLSILEVGLLQFLDDLSQTTSQLVAGEEGASLRMWIYAAAGAGAACLIAYRQQRRSSGLCAADVPQLPGCSLDDDD